LQHVSIARGSLAELETYFELAARLTYVAPEQAAPLLEQAGGVGRQLTALRNALLKEPA
jgi:four helix bundle protein